MAKKTGKPPGKAGMVRVEVTQKMSIDGILISPDIEPRRNGPPKITPRQAVIPRERAKAHGCKILGDATGGVRMLSGGEK